MGREGKSIEQENKGNEKPRQDAPEDRKDSSTRDFNFPRS